MKSTKSMKSNKRAAKKALEATNSSELDNVFAERKITNQPAYDPDDSMYSDTDIERLPSEGADSNNDDIIKGEYGENEQANDTDADISRFQETIMKKRYTNSFQQNTVPDTTST